MSQSRPYAIKVIAVLGLMAFLVLLLTLQTLKKQIEPDAAQMVKVLAKRSNFDRARAWKDLESIYGGGAPRPVGTPGFAAAAEYILVELKQAKIPAEMRRYSSGTNPSYPPFTAVHAQIKGTSPGLIVFCTPLDGPARGPAAHFGANATASGPAWLLEMARIWGTRRDGRSLCLVWYGGESTGAGAHEFAAELNEAEAVFHIAAVADRYLGLAPDPRAPDWLRSAVWKMAERLNYGRHFSEGIPLSKPIASPFRIPGLPVIDLMDFPFGGSIAQHRLLWGSEQDTLEASRSESLQAVADVIYHALAPVEAELNARRKVQDL